MNIYKSISDLVGHTPLLRLESFEKSADAKAEIIAKLEYLNPAGSAKDRIALEMLRDATASGKLAPGGTIIEPTSGNTGIGLAAIAAREGYRVIITMPDTMSPERIATMKAYGAEVVLTPGKEGMAGAIARAEEMARTIPGSVVAGQFVNPANPAAHYKTTGPEIWDDTDGTVDIFVCGVGTGGTITGVSKYLKEKNPAVKIIGIEPADSPVLSGGCAGPHGLQGIGAGFVPDVLDTTLIDEIITVTTDEAYIAGRALSRTEGILCGISSGAALHGAAVVSSREENQGKRIVVLLPDTGTRYLSTDMFQV